MQEYNEKLEEEIALARSGPERLDQLRLQAEQVSFLFLPNSEQVV